MKTTGYFCIFSAKQSQIVRIVYSLMNKVVLAKLGLDGHVRGIQAIAYALKGAGWEVVYLGLANTPKNVVKAVIEEDAKVIGLSFLSGEHIGMTKKVFLELKKNNVDVPVVVGGCIPYGDIVRLKKMGVLEVFTSGTLLSDIVNFFEKLKH